MRSSNWREFPSPGWPRLVGLLLAGLALPPTARGDGFEDNDSCADAVNYLGGPQTLDVQADDEDWYSLSYSYPTALFVDLDELGGDGDIALELYAPDCPGAPLRSSNRSTHSEAIVLQDPAPGFVTLRVYLVGGTTRNYKLRISRVAPGDLAVVRPPGWFAPLVPVPSPAGTPQFDPWYQPAPAMVAGDGVTPSCFAFSTRITRIPPCLVHGLFIDGVNSASGPTGESCLSGSGDDLWLAQGPGVLAGRHTVRWMADYAQQVPEIDETNNVFEAQYVWDVYGMSLGQAGYRAAPAAGTGPIPNCDAIRVSVPQGQTWAVGGSYPYQDFSLYAFDDYVPGDVNSFSHVSAASQSPPGLPEFLVASRQVPLNTVVFGINTPSVTSTSVLMGSASAPPAVPGAALGLYWDQHVTPGAGFFKIYEAYFEAGFTYALGVTRTAGFSHLSFSVFRPDAATLQSPAEALAHSIDVSETSARLDFTPSRTGYYPIVVSTSDFFTTATFTFFWVRPVTGVGEHPTVERRPTLASAPNPFAASARFFVGAPPVAGATVDIYDLRGRRVRTLPVEPAPAQAQRVLDWDGRDATTGRAVPAGLYWARLMAEGRVLATHRLVRVD